MIDEEGHVKIIDFGLVKHLLPGESTKSFVGTPDYMSPVCAMHCAAQAAIVTVSCNLAVATNHGFLTEFGSYLTFLLLPCRK